MKIGKAASGTGQPILGNLTFDGAGLAGAGGFGTATFAAEQVTLQNSLGGTVTPPPQIGGTALALDIIASDVLGIDPSATATGVNNAQISLGTGAFTLAGFTNVLFKS